MLEAAEKVLALADHPILCLLALEGFSEALAHELDPAWNIKVSVVRTLTWLGL